jgi:hypothetical protein
VRRRSEGWAVKVLWVMPQAAIDPVTLSARNTSTGQPVLFDIAGRDAAPLPSEPALDPKHPAIPPEANKGVRAFPSELFFPSAGCYELSASSIEKSWTLGSASAGRAFGGSCHSRGAAVRARHWVARPAA